MTAVTENPTETNETSEATPEPKSLTTNGEYTGYDGPDALSGQLLTKYFGIVSEFKEVNSRLLAAEGARDEAIADFIENSDNPQAVKLRKAIETAQNKLAELAEQSVQESTVSDEEKEKLRVRKNSLSEQVKSSVSAIQQIATSMSSDKDGVLAALAEIGNPASSGRGRKPGQAGSNLPRISAHVYLSGGNFDKEEYVDSFSKLALKLNTEVKDLQLAFAKAAGVSHEDIKTVKSPVTFKYQVNGQGAEYTIRTEPKDRAKPGPKTDKPGESK